MITQEFNPKLPKNYPYRLKFYLARDLSMTSDFLGKQVGRGASDFTKQAYVVKYVSDQGR